ncbi:phosphotransferase [Caballeronia sp. dw_19]|uniref:phosphotransferase n=1 Tax=Caballeronia sp. dw_19 TaxID=2719791 RepID=UPI001BD5AACF|nr:phosphotransferase [Caballeronia sp. dw_19]
MNTDEYDDRPDMSEAAAGCDTATISCDEARAIALEHYGIDALASRLTGEQDENFRLETAGATRYVLKVASPAEAPSVIDLATAALLHVAASDNEFPCPRVCIDRRARTATPIVDAAGHPRIARMLTWLPGQPLLTSERSAAQRVACGRLAARLGSILRTFDHPAARRPLLWDVSRVSALLDILDQVPGFSASTFIGGFVTQFEAATRPVSALLRRQVVHNDMNVRNLLVDPHDNTRIVGLIDFGDIVETALVADVAIVASSQITALESLERDLAETVDAYRSVEPLLPAELAVLNWYIAARLVMGMLIPAWHHLRNPSSGHFIPKTEADLARRIDMVRKVMSIRFT